MTITDDEPGTKPLPPVIFSDDDEGTDGDGNPVGLLMWGQAGVYNGVDDRSVITALIDNAVGGVVRPPSITAGPGLTFNVGAGWLAVASCGDGTNAVIGARQTHTVTETAGPPTGARNDLLWADTYPDEGRWVLRIIREDQMPGRPGLPLARITVPAGANLASQMTVTGDVHFLSPKVDTDPRQNHGTSTLEWLTPRYPFAIYGMRRDSMFRLTAFGSGDVGTGPSNMRFRGGGVELEVLTAPLGLGAASRLFSWECEVISVFAHRFAEGIANTKIAVTVTRTPAAGSPSSSVRAVRYAGSVAFGAGPWLGLGLQMYWTAGVLANANIDCSSSAFEAVGKPW